jgi:hypothetical protein
MLNKLSDDFTRSTSNPSSWWTNYLVLYNLDSFFSNLKFNDLKNSMIVVGHIQSDFFLVLFFIFNQFFYEVRINCGKIFKDIFCFMQRRCFSIPMLVIFPYWQPELHYWIFKHDRIFWVMFAFAAIRKTSDLVWHWSHHFHLQLHQNTINLFFLE